MAAYTLARRLTPTLALIAAGALGVLVALATLLLPGYMLEDVVLASGIPAFIPAAEPPLGATATICVAVFAGGGVAAACWIALNVLMGMMPSRATVTIVRRPTVRRADAHPDAPPREPLRAGRDLGFDLPSPDDLDADDQPIERTAIAISPEPVIAMGAPAPASPVIAPESPPPPPVQPMPFDLDQPLAAYDPGAVLETPLVPPPTVPPLHRNPQPPVFDHSERFETFDLTPPQSPTLAEHTAAIAAPETTATVHALLSRLEQGIARREDRAKPVPPPRRLNDTLADLRKLAVRA